MRILRQVGVVALLLVSALAPTMTCMVSGALMTAEERACCRMMHDQCEQMNIPDSHGCCHKTPTNLGENALGTKAFTRHASSITAAWLVPSELLNPTAATSKWVEQTDSSPPKSPPPAVSILRI